MPQQASSGTPIPIGTDHALAEKQWNALHKIIGAEAEIVLIAMPQGVPDFVYTANAGLVLGSKVIVSRFYTKERRNEEPYFRDWFKQNGFTILPWPKNVTFEGAGDALIDRGQPLIWDGHGFRSGIEAQGLIEKISRRKVVTVKLVDARFYHLDTCLCPLEGGWLMYYPAAFDEESQKKIAAHIPPEKRIVVSEKDALSFACNAVDLNRRVIMNEASDELKNDLRRAGFTPVTTPLSEFMKGGGSAKCLTLKLVET